MYLALRHYSRPRDVAQCLALLHQPGEETALLSGGTDLNARDNETVAHLIDTQELPIDGITVEGDALRIGAGVTLAHTRRHELCQRPIMAAVREACAAFANRGIQNRSTIGGRIAIDRSDQDVPTALAALGARISLARLDGDKVVSTAIDYPLGSARQALKNVLITEVLLPAGEGRSALRRFGRTAVDLPLATCAAGLVGGTLRLAANAQGPGAADLRRMEKTEKLAAAWIETRPADWRAAARRSLLEELASYGDARASGAYRQDLSATMTIRALAAVLGEEEIA